LSDEVIIEVSSGVISRLPGATTIVCESSSNKQHVIATDSSPAGRSSVEEEVDLADIGQLA
jgi:hypothetical protein